MKQHKGAVVIMVTAVMLVALLLLVLGSYRATYHQIKVGQNELKLRQTQWQAEGAIECLYSYIRVTSTAPDQLTKGSSTYQANHMQSLCLSTPSLEALFTESLMVNRYRLVYQLNGVTRLSKAIEYHLPTGHYYWLQGSWNDY